MYLVFDEVIKMAAYAMLFIVCILSAIDATVGNKANKPVFGLLCLAIFVFLSLEWLNYEMVKPKKN